MKLRINYFKLSRAYNGSDYAFASPLLNRWLVRRCRVCGKMEYPKGKELIAQCDEHPPVYYLCHDHGGENGKTYMDAHTGLEVEVGPAPRIFLKTVLDSWIEALFWLWVIIKYGAIVLGSIIYHFFHLRKWYKFKKWSKEVGFE